MTNKTEKNEGELLVIPSQKLLNTPGAFEALMRFQYGDNPMGAFEELKKVSNDK